MCKLCRDSVLSFLIELKVKNFFKDPHLANCFEKILGLEKDLFRYFRTIGTIELFLKKAGK